MRLAIFSMVLIASAVVPLLPLDLPQDPEFDFPGWPTHWEGAKLTRMELDADEDIFRKNFPGRLARFHDGQNEITIRWLSRVTRKLHPVADCLKGKGYPVEVLAGIEIDDHIWGHLETETPQGRLDVRECYFESDFKKSWSDVSQWFWAGFLGESAGPWWVVTVVTKSK